MKCATCASTGVEKPQVLCPPCIERIGGNAFLFCAKCRKVWSAIDQEQSFPHFSVIPGVTYTTTGCSDCRVGATEIRIIEEGEALRKVSFSDKDLRLRMQNVDVFDRRLLVSALEEKAVQMRLSRHPSMAAYNVVCRTIMALRSSSGVFRSCCRTWLLVIVPGRGVRRASLDAIKLEES